MSSQICRHSLQIATAPVPASPETCVRRLPQKLQRSRACSSESAASTPIGVSACEPVEMTSVARPTQRSQIKTPGPPTRRRALDVEPGAEERTEFVLACRVYWSEHGIAGQPDEDWIRAALVEAAG